MWKQELTLIHLFSPHPKGGREFQLTKESLEKSEKLLQYFLITVKQADWRGLIMIGRVIIDSRVLKILLNLRISSLKRITDELTKNSGEKEIKSMTDSILISEGSAFSSLLGVITL